MLANKWKSSKCNTELLLCLRQIICILCNGGMMRMIKELQYCVNIKAFHQHAPSSVLHLTRIPY